MRGKAIGGLAAVALMSSIWGYNLHPDVKVETHTKVRTVKVPHIIAKKTVEEKVVVKNVGFPEACETAIDMVMLTANQSNKVNSSAKKFYTYVDELDERLLSDPEAAHKAEQWLFEQSAKVDELLYGNLEAAERMKTSYSLCQSDLDRAKRGDDFTVADGRHVTIP